MMPGPDGLFARRFPIGMSCFEHLAIHGFSQRRFDLFAIFQFAWQSCVKGLLSLVIDHELMI